MQRRKNKTSLLKQSIILLTVDRPIVLTPAKSNANVSNATLTLVSLRYNYLGLVRSLLEAIFPANHLM